jgi:hypothetical protein
MAPCHKIQSQLAAYVEAELSAEEAHLLALHLAVCSACAREAEAYRQSLALLRRRRVAPVPKDLHAGFAAKLAACKQFALRPPPLRWAWTGVLGSVIGAIMGLWFFGFGTDNKAPKKQMVVSFSHSRPSLPIPHAGMTSVPEKKSGGERKVLASITKKPALSLHPHRRQQIQTTPIIRVVHSSSLRRSQWIRHQVVRAERTAIHHSQEAASENIEPMIVVPALNDSVQIGDTLTRVRSASGWHANGQLAMIRVEAETVSIE